MPGLYASVFNLSDMHTVVDDPQTKRKLIKLVAKSAPLTYNLLFGRRYIPPANRQNEYCSLEKDDWMSFERLFAYADLKWDMTDEVANIALWNLCASLNYSRPTLFLERELGEALLRTEILGDLSCEDIHWRWPAFRVVLPRYLISIERASQTLCLTHFEVCYSPLGKPFECPRNIAREIDQFTADFRERQNYHCLERGRFSYKDREDGVGFSAALDRPDNDRVHQTIYGLAKPWGPIKLGESRAVTGDLHSPLPQDDADRLLLRRLEHLILNVLLYLSAVPDDGVVGSSQFRDKVLRKQNLRELKPALLEARFVGHQQFRPAITPIAKTSDPTGRTMAAHWVCGAWRRVPYGPKSSLRRLTWIKPYATGELRQNVA